MSLEIKNFLEEKKNHVCSAQSDSVSSLQFDKRIKSRSYSSQFTLSDLILVGIDRREEMRPIEQMLTVEVDLCTGTISDIKSTIHSKYHTIIHLDEMSQSNAWVKKMITYDGFVDKNVMQSIRDEAMEPNKLYLLKHKHKEQTTESMAGNFSENRDVPDSKKLRTTAAQFNPNENDNKFVVDRYVSSSNNNNARNAFFKSTNVLRNELIIRTGDFIDRSIENDPEKYSTSLSVDLTTHKIPQIVSIKDLTIYDDDDLETPKPTENVKTEEPAVIEFDFLENQKTDEPAEIELDFVENQKTDELAEIELNLVENQKTSLEVDDIPFAEESEILIEHDTVDSKRNTLSKSLQYYLPVFDINQDDTKPDENEDMEGNSVYSRSAVTTDENESMDHTDRPTLLDEIDYESLNADEFDESMTENKKDSISSLKEIDNYSFSSGRNSFIFDKSIDLDDIICQENLVIHINQDPDQNIINLNKIPKFQQLESGSKIPISQFDIKNVKRNVSLSPTFQHHFHKNKSIDFPRDFIEQRKEHLGKSESPINEIYFFNENQIESKNDNYNYGNSSEDLNSTNEDAQIFTKTRSFSLKRKSEHPEEVLILDDPNLQIYPKKDDEKPPNNLYSDRKEKFFNSNLSSSILFFKHVSEDIKFPEDTRCSTPCSETETESVKKDEISTNSSDDSMIIKDVSSDGAYEYRGRPRNINNKIEEEDENEITNTDSNEDLSNITNLTEEIPQKEKDYSSSENLSVYSSSSTFTGSERILRELNKTPIDSNPGYFEKFLQEREERILKERNSTDETSSYSEGKIEHATFIKRENLEKPEEVENTNESSYSEDTLSSSSNFHPKINTVLRQGESIEDIAKYLIYPKKENKGLIRTSGFDSQLNVIYNEEDNNTNLLQNESIKKRKFSTSSEDDTSLKMSFPQNKFIERTEKHASNNIPDKKSFPKNESDEESSSETVDSDSDSDTDSDTDSQQELPQKSIALQPSAKTPSKVFVATKLNKQQSLPILNTGEISSTSESDSTNSISISTEEIQQNIDKDEKKKLPKYIERGEKFTKNPPITKQTSLPAKKTKGSSSDSESGSSSISISTSEDEINPANLKVTDRRETQLSAHPIKEHKKITVSKKILSNLSKSSESSQSFSTSEDETPPPKEIKAIKTPSNHKVNSFSSQSLNKKSPILTSKKNSSSSSSSNMSGKIRSASISSNESQHSYVNLTQSKFAEQEKSANSQSKDKKIISSIPRKEFNSSSTSSSESVPTSSDEDQHESDEGKKPHISIEHREKFANNKGNSNISKKLPEKQTNLDQGNDLSYSESSLTKTSNENSKSSKRSSSPTQKKDEIIKPEIITNTVVLAQEKDKSYTSDTTSSDESTSLTFKNDSTRQDSKTPPNLSIDRREKFTKLNSTRITSGFKRSSSVPDYLVDSSRFSVTLVDDNIRHQNRDNLAQSLKVIPTDPNNNNNMTSNRKTQSYELLSVELKENVITRFIESRRKYTDKLSYTDLIENPQSNVEYASKKNSSLSIDRREKFCSAEEFDRITPYEDMKELNKENNAEDNEKNKFNNGLLDKDRESQNQDDSCSIGTSDSLTESSDEEKDIRYVTPKVNTNKQFYSIDRLEKFTDQNNLENHKLNKSKSKERNSSSESSEYDNLSNKNKKTINIDHNEKFDELKNLKNKISRPKSKEIPSNYSDSSSSSESESISADDDQKSPNKVIEHREKFTDNNSNSKITKKQSGIPVSLDGESDSSYSESSSTFKSNENNKRSANSGQISSDKGNQIKLGEIERYEKNINQNARQIQYEQSKSKSDSTDEDVTLSLTSLPKENHHIESDRSSHYSDTKELEIIVVEKDNHESKLNDADPSISISTTSSVSKDRKVNHRYEKNDKYVSRSCQTLPYNKIQIIPIKQKSKSLDKPFIHGSLPVLNQNMSGSFGSIIERRYHEFTENWSSKSPIGSNNSKENILTKIVDDEHISSVKNTDIFTKRKFKGPLTTRPRPFPSYLSPVNAFPYVPIDPEFSSADSLVNDYSSDYNANEIIPRYKSLPEFVKSLSTTSLPKHPVELKTETKKRIVKKKSPPQPINLYYGAVENKNFPRHTFKKKTSLTSVTTDSSYLEKPILKERFNNYASSDSLGSLTSQSMQRDITKSQQQKTNLRAQIPKNKVNIESISSTDSSSDSDTQIEFERQPLTPVSHLPKVNSITNNKNRIPIPPIVNGKQGQIKKSNSLPQKRIPSSSESSEFSSSSDDDDSAEIHHF